MWIIYHISDISIAFVTVFWVNYDLKIVTDIRSLKSNKHKSSHQILNIIKQLGTWFIHQYVTENHFHVHMFHIEKGDHLKECFLWLYMRNHKNIHPAGVIKLPSQLTRLSAFSRTSHTVAIPNLSQAVAVWYWECPSEELNLTWSVGSILADPFN